MTVNKQNLNKKQELFRNMFVGILLYSVVLGFFNDYTKILHTGTYSITFLMAIVMQILTYLTYLVKDKFVDWFNNRKEPKSKLLLVFGVWLVVFLSKFVFLWVIDLVFRGTVEISGFLGLLLMIVILTIIQKLAEIAYSKLGN
ncbi:MAG: hypothetical protein WCK26_00295 [Candidatus Saccharibacteria bacterium]